MTEIMPVPRNLILLSYQQRSLPALLFAVADLDIFAKSVILKIQGCYRQTSSSHISYKEVTAVVKKGRLLLFAVTNLDIPQIPVYT